MRDMIDLPVERCADGYLQNPDDWDENLARQLASEWYGLEFTEDHLPVLHFVRSFYEEHQITPDVRDATKFLMTMGMDKKEAKKYLFKLFPREALIKSIRI